MAKPAREAQPIRRSRGYTGYAPSLPLIAAWVIPLLPVRRSAAEDRLDLKTLYYQEDGDRVRVIAPSILLERDLPHDVTIRLDAIYNDISGATPTGAPPYESQVQTITTRIPAPAPAAEVSGPAIEPGEEEEEEEDELEDRLERRRRSRAARLKANGPAYFTLAGATPAPAPAPAPSGGGGGASTGGGYTVTTQSVTNQVPSSKVPKVDTEDTRIGLNLDLAKRMGNHTPSVMLSNSTESDYLSWGIALRDAIDFNQKNTTLLVGVAGAFDTLEGSNIEGSEDKTTVDAILGLTQVLDRRTLLTVNATFGNAEGYLGDPYKVVQLNGVLIPEKRPDSKDKQVLYLALNRHIDTLRGALEASYRLYQDSFEIDANTFGLAWYQQLGKRWILRPAVRLYQQSAAEFYAVEFTGSPEYYSSDYRVSEFDALGYGLKLIYSPSERLSLDIAYEQYSQDGQDGITVDDAYVDANYLIVGCRLWF